MCRHIRCDKLQNINNLTMIISVTLYVIVILISRGHLANGAETNVAKTSDRLISPLCVDNEVHPKIFR